MYKPALALTILLTACASQPPVRGEYTPGIEPLFQAFAGCQTSVFRHVEENRSQYEKLGKLKPTPLGGMWFDGDKRSEGVTVLTLDKPLKINGLTVIAIGYSQFRYPELQDRGSDYWGFFFKESADTVRTSLAPHYPLVFSTRKMFGDSWANLLSVRYDGNKKIEHVGIIEGGNSVPGANAFFNCSIQIQTIR